MSVALAHALVGELLTAEDVAQQSFIQAYLNLGSLRDPSRFPGWLCSIVSQESAKHHRWRGRHPTVSADPGLLDVQDPVGSPPDLAADEERRSLVRRAVLRLPSKLKTVLVMRFFAELPCRAIAHQLGLRPGAVRVRLHRAIRVLRQSLANAMEAGQ